MVRREIEVAFAERSSPRKCVHLARPIRGGFSGRTVTWEDVKTRNGLWRFCSAAAGA